MKETPERLARTENLRTFVRHFWYTPGASQNNVATSGIIFICLVLWGFIVAHSPEPWRPESTANEEILIVDAAGKSTIGCLEEPSSEEDCETKAANTLRLVACVNFCAGIPTDALETITAAKSFQRQIQLLCQHYHEALVATK